MNRLKTRRAQRIFRVLAAALAIVPSTLSLRAGQGSQPLLAITFPASGTVVSPGQTIAVSVESPANTPFAVVGLLGGDLGFLGAAPSVPAQFPVTIPADIAAARPYLLTASGRTVAGQNVSATTLIDVERPDRPSSISAQLSQIIFDVQGEDVSIILLATFPDGKVLDVTRSSNVTYASSNPNVAAVDAAGVVTSTGEGSGSITATYGPPNQNVQLTIPVRVAASVLVASPNPLNFGDQNVGTATAQQVTLVNRSRGALSILGVQAETDGDFTTTDNCMSSSPLAVGATCTIVVIFRPTASGLRTGAIRVANSFYNVPTGILLRGTGAGASIPTLSALGPARFWIGLPNNSEAPRLRLDARAEVLLDGAVVGSGELVDIPARRGGFRDALLQTVNLALPGGPVNAPSGAQLAVRVSVRRTCTGGGPRSGTVRLWYNGQPIDSGAKRDAGSRFRATIGGTDSEYFLKAAASLSTTAGSSRQFVNTRVTSRAACPSRPFVPMGTWSLSLP